ncbi:hypothetical protein K440DRAFT_673835 [Wilcoxina mikolae CBS 423.85]|nr:hypothetical protein K440DRAFT_673835 [Wilcoxina mikolae CBS 423.85]
MKVVEAVAAAAGEDEKAPRTPGGGWMTAGLKTSQPIVRRVFHVPQCRRALFKEKKKPSMEGKRSKLLLQQRSLQRPAIQLPYHDFSTLPYYGVASSSPFPPRNTLLCTRNYHTISKQPLSSELTREAYRISASFQFIIIVFGTGRDIPILKYSMLSRILKHLCAEMQKQNSGTN